MNTIHIEDYRNEDRKLQASYRDGTVQEKPMASQVWSYHGVHRHDEREVIASQTKVADVRTVAVKIDIWGDTQWGVIPEVLPETTDGRIENFFVDHVRFTWRRNLGEPEWELSKIYISGDNYRKDGSRGSITGATAYPKLIRHEVPTGKIKDETYFRMPYDELSAFKQAWWGGPVTKTVYETQPLPDWLDVIVSKSHPVTGDVAFTFGDQHVYGEFA